LPSFSVWHEAFMTSMQLVEIRMTFVGTVISPDAFVFRRSISSYFSFLELA